MVKDENFHEDKEPRASSRVSHYGLILLVFSFLVFVFGALFGRTLFGSDGGFGFWTSDAWGASCSQRLADPYSFSHIAHGLIFYYLLWVFARSWSLKTRFFTATALEAFWEILENSPIIINRYRDATAAIGYVGDSLLNSVGDLFFMALGFFLARRLPIWASFSLLLAMEIGCAFWIRDNLTFNVIMLLYPIESIKTWQAGLA